MGEDERRRRRLLAPGVANICVPRPADKKKEEKIQTKREAIKFQFITEVVTFLFQLQKLSVER